MAFSNDLKCDLRPRSGLSLKGINVAFGTIDPDYRAEVKAIVTNTTLNSFHFPIGYRVGQLVFSPVSQPEAIEVKSLPSTSRGNNGFGSTGNFSRKSARRVKPHNSFISVLPTI